jgi:cellulose-binding protein
MGGAEYHGHTDIQLSSKPRVLISTDIGGTDSDDFQSMIHFLVYADMFEVEGLISSPPGKGTTAHILEVIDAYAVDFNNLQSSSVGYPPPDALRAVTKEGASKPAPASGYSPPTEGSAFIVAQARKTDARPLYILAWGGLTDVAQAIHDEPSIKSNIRLISNGGWNTSKDRFSRAYLFNSHQDLWWIEGDPTFKGMSLGGNQKGDLHNKTFVAQHVKGHDALGELFYNKLATLKMGDAPTVLYLINGDPDAPTTPHWGGMFATTAHSPTYWTDTTDPLYKHNSYFGAETVQMWRKAYLRDFQIHLDRCQ